MIKRPVILVIASVLLFGSAFNSAQAKNGRQTKNIGYEKSINPHYISTVSSEFAPEHRSFATDDPIGTVYYIGTSWWDLQNACTTGRQVQVDSEGYVHLVWMNGLNSGATQRHAYYQLIDPLGNLMFGNGVQINNVSRAGYPVLVVHEDNRALPVFHQGPGGTVNFHTTVSNDFMPRIGAFQSTELPWVYELATDLEIIWPKADIDINNRIHVISHENPPGGANERAQRNYYGWAEYDPLSFSMTTCESQELVCWTNVIASNVAASPVSERVVVGWLEMNATSPDTTQYDNDLIICISEDGETWDWTDTINVTNFVPPDSSYLPDTTIANRDTLRVFPDICPIFDYNDVLHVFFSTRGYYSLEGTITWGNGFIWHWDEINQVFSVVANGWFENGNYDPGDWNVYASRSSVAIDPVTEDIYCMYQRYINPIDTSQTLPYPYMLGDTTDFSAGGLPNGDVWVTKSTNGGWSWAEGINITSTYTPGAEPGNCASELSPNMAPQIFNDNLFIFYVLDKDAGAVVLEEGTWTLNDIICQVVPIDTIPATPLLQQYPMHFDSTGFPTGSAIEEIPHDKTPVKFTLNPPHPNPFNQRVALDFVLPVAAPIKLTVFDITGREVANLIDGYQSAGNHEIIFHAKDLASGVYLVRLSAGGRIQTQKIVLMK